MRQLPRVVAFAALALTSITLLPHSASAQTARAHAPLELVYAKLDADRELKLDLFRPASDGPFPCVIYLHGGGWEGGSHKLPPSATAPLLARGLAVAAVEYRLSGEARFPAQIHDAKRAVRFLRRQAEALGLDGDRLGALGMSAGAHLALLLAVTDADDGLEPPGDHGDEPTSTRVRCVSAWAGPTDLLHCETDENRKTVRRLLQELLGETAEQAPALYERASPITYATADDPPVLLIHGMRDGLVIPSQATRFAAALREAKAPVELLLIENLSHGAPKGGLPNPSMAEVNRRSLDFLERYLKAERKPALR